MENNDQRIKTLSEQEKSTLFYNADTLLRESLQDTEITPAEHRRLFDVFQSKTEEFFSDMQQGSSDAMRYRRICMLFHSKEDPDRKRQTLREQLQSQIDVGDIHDAGGKIKPETLWGVICHQSPELKDKYTLDGIYDEKDDALTASVVATSASLALYSQKTAHLRR